MRSAFSHPAVTSVRDFNSESDDVEAQCNSIAAQLMAGEITEDEFDAGALHILGEDYHPDECVAEYVDSCDCPDCAGGVWECSRACGRLQTRGDGRRCPACVRELRGLGPLS